MGAKTTIARALSTKPAAETPTASTVSLPASSRHQLADRAHDLGGVLGRRLGALAGHDLAVLVDESGRDLGAADVDADREAHGSSSQPSPSSRSIFSTGEDGDGPVVWVASNPAAACISELAATERCSRTSGLVERTTWIAWQTGQ